MAINIELENRRGNKNVTVISNIQHNPQVIEKLEKQLKQKCGAGGTSYGKTIEIQGDHVNNVSEYLKKKGYHIKG